MWPSRYLLILAEALLSLRERGYPGSAAALPPSGSRHSSGR